MPSRRNMEQVNWWINSLGSVLPYLFQIYNFADQAGQRSEENAAFDDFQEGITTKPSVTPKGSMQMPRVADFAGQAAPVPRETMGVPANAEQSALFGAGAPGGTQPAGSGVTPSGEISPRGIPQRPSEMRLPADMTYDAGGDINISPDDMAALFARVEPGSPVGERAMNMYTMQQQKKQDARAETDEQWNEKMRNRKEKEWQLQDEDRVGDKQAQKFERAAKRLKFYEDAGFVLNDAIPPTQLRTALESWETESPMLDINGTPLIVPKADYMPGSVAYMRGNDGKMYLTYRTRSGMQKTEEIPDMKYKVSTEPKPRATSPKTSKTSLEDLLG